MINARLLGIAMLLATTACASRPVREPCNRAKRPLPREVRLGHTALVLGAALDSARVRTVPNVSVVGVLRHRVVEPTIDSFDTVFVRLDSVGKIRSIEVVFAPGVRYADQVATYRRHYGRPSVVGVTDFERGGYAEDVSWLDDRTELQVAEYVWTDLLRRSVRFRLTNESWQCAVRAAAIPRKSRAVGLPASPV